MILNKTLQQTLGKAKVLTPAQYAQACRDLMDPTTRERGEEALVRGNIRLVLKLVGPYEKVPTPFEDVFLAGMSGLLRAARKFDPTRGVRFSTYARAWILQVARVEIEKDKTVHLPSTWASDGRFPGHWVPLGQRATAERVDYHCHSLDAPAYEEGTTPLSRLDLLESEGPDAHAQLVETMRRERVERLVETLPVRLARVITLTFGLSGHKEHTYQEVADMFGLSRERVRQLRDMALLRLRGKALAEADAGRL